MTDITYYDGRDEHKVAELKIIRSSETFVFLEMWLENGGKVQVGSFKEEI